MEAFKNGTSLTTETEDGRGLAFFLQAHDITAVRRLVYSLEIGDCQGNVLFLNLNMGGDLLEKELQEGAHDIGGIQFRVILVRGYEGQVAVAELSSRVRAMTVEKLLECFGTYSRTRN